MAAERKGGLNGDRSRQGKGGSGGEAHRGAVGVLGEVGDGPGRRQSTADDDDARSGNEVDGERTGRPCSI